MKQMKRLWKNYNKWEDFVRGFYDSKTKYTEELQRKIEDTLTSEEFFDTAMVLFLEWPNSINHNLSYTGSNRKSYLGQAVCCYLHGATAKTTSEIFTKMEKSKQITANKIAERIIEKYEEDFYKEPV